MEDNFVLIQNEDQDYSNTSVHKDDNADGKQKGQVNSFTGSGTFTRCNN